MPTLGLIIANAIMLSMGSYPTAFQLSLYPYPIERIAGGQSRVL